MNLLVFGIFFILGIIVDYFGSARETGGKDSFFKSSIFYFKEYRIHIHHWILYLIFLIILLFFSFYNDVLFGLLIGGIIHSLRFKDCYKIVIKM